MPDEEAPDRGFWRTLPGVLTAVGGLLTGAAALLGALAAAGVIGGGGSEVSGETRPPVRLTAGAEVAAGRIERGCLDFWGEPPSVCRCVGEHVAAALPPEDLDGSSAAFRDEGRFPTAEQQALADDTLRSCEGETR